MLWYRHGSPLLLDMGEARSRGYLDVEHYKNMLLMAVEKAEERLMSGWYPKVIGLFSGESKMVGRLPASEAESFHDCVTTLLGNQVSSRGCMHTHTHKLHPCR